MPRRWTGPWSGRRSRARRSRRGCVRARRSHDRLGGGGRGRLCGGGGALGGGGFLGRGKSGLDLGAGGGSRARVVPLTGHPARGTRREGADTGLRRGGRGRRGGGGSRGGRGSRGGGGARRGRGIDGDVSTARPRQAMQRLLDAQKGRDREDDDRESGDREGRRPRRQHHAGEDDDREVPEVQRVRHVAEGDGEGIGQHEEMAVTRVAGHSARDHQSSTGHGQRRPGRGEGSGGVHHEERRDDDRHTGPGPCPADRGRDAGERAGARGEHRTHGEFPHPRDGREVRQRGVARRQHHGGGTGCHHDREREDRDRRAGDASATGSCGQERHRQQHQEGPDEGELLFDRERPEVLQG